MLSQLSKLIFCNVRIIIIEIIRDCKKTSKAMSSAAEDFSSNDYDDCDAFPSERSCHIDN